jgi:hypothetical protein
MKNKPSRKAAGVRKKASKAVLQAKQQQPPPAPVAQSEPQPPSPPQRTPDRHDPIVVCTVTHRKRFDEENRQLGHVGMIQERKPEKLKLCGKAFAAWAFLTRDGIPSVYPERFETYDTREEAIAHAEYAASRKPR